ncbi:MAG: sulfatase [Planctomycetes bacterium]|nr:sulfatase [Planctomycetota bacterium]
MGDADAAPAFTLSPPQLVTLSSSTAPPATTRHPACLFAALLALWPIYGVAADAERPTNFVVILCDNLGYGDIGCFGSTKHRTPHVDRLAREGRKFTSFYATSGVCTPSRASLMTACYPRRVSMHVDERGGQVLRPVSSKGLHPDEVTIAEVLKGRGYATACVGKWHLGDQPAFLPTRQGFELYFGIPYSDDMTPREGQNWPPLPLMRGERVVEAPADRNTLTKRYTEEAVRFIAEHKSRPFFLYLPHAMPGSTQRPFASEDFQGRSANGAYGDCVEELDWSTGEIVAALRKHGLEEHTLVVWTSDNGAPRHNPPQGSNRPLGGWGYTTMEGGMRIPCIFWQPGRVPPGTVCDELATTMDLLPTFALLANSRPPEDRTIDGKDIRPLIFGEPDAQSSYEAFYYYQGDDLQAVRSGKWKLHLPLKSARPNARDGRPLDELLLYDVTADPGETRNVAAQHGDVVQRLMAFADRARNHLGDGAQPGRDQRPAGHVEKPQPQQAAEATR